jgi:broad specificity phosphatase PhoE
VVTQVYLIRHGETQWSLTGQHTSRTDVPLTAHGEEQARQVGRLLQSTRFDQVLVSPLQRARRTCQLAGVDAGAGVDRDLSEWDYGEYEGRTTADIRTRHPGWDLFRDGCPGGESVEQMCQRVERVLAGVRQMQGRVALFSHGHFLRALAVHWIDLPIRHGRYLDLDPGSLSVLAHDHNDIDAPVISLWNAVSSGPDMTSE